MPMFGLPKSTVVNKFLPKNSFDSYTNTRQKKKFSELIQRITWQNKLAKETINLSGNDVMEIQVFRVELKSKKKIDDLLLIIDRAIPYNIVFVVIFENELYLSAAVKHPHPLNPNNAVVDYTFESDWMKHEELTHKFVLRNSLDDTFNQFCKQINRNDIPFPKTGEETDNDIDKYIERIKEKAALEREIKKIKTAISKEKQFNRKVELNLKLKEFEQKISALRY